MRSILRQHTITEEYFGRNKLFYNSLLSLGFLNGVCALCHERTITLFFETGRSFPRTYCTNCSKRVPSCIHGSFFESKGISDIPAFFFVVECFILRLTLEATTVLSGLNEKTVRKYLDVIRVVVNSTIERRYEEMELSLGGPGKIIEIDEMIATKRKYGKGRIPAKQCVLIFGMTELEGGPVQVTDPELFNYILEKDRSREPEIGGNTPGLRPAQQRQRVQQNTTNEMTEDRYVMIDEDTRVVYLDEAGNDDDNETLEQAAPPEGLDAPGHRPRFRVDPVLEGREQKLFGQTQTSPRRTVLFRVPNRKATTLIPIIEKYVKMGSIIFSDKWSAYVTLN